MDIAFNIGMEFALQFKKRYGRNLCSIKNLRTSRWWSHFEKSATFISGDDVKGFISFFFEQDYEDKILYPFELVSKKTRELYKNYRAVKANPITNSVSPNVILTIRNILTWCKNKGIEENRMEHFLANRSNIMKIENGTLYEPVFFFSKTYLDGRFIKDLGLKRGILLNRYPAECLAIQKVFKDDYV